MASTLLNNIVLAYKLDGNSNDSVGSSNGSDTSITYSSGNGKIVQGAGFNGTSSVIKNTTFALPTTEITIAAWVKTTDTSTAKELFLLGADGVLDANSARAYQFRLELASGGARKAGWIPFPGGVATVLTGTTINCADGNWHLVIGRSKSGSQKLTIDNSTEATATASGTNTARTGFAIGDLSENPSAHQFVAGAEDELYIWDRFLTDAECTELYNGGAGLQYPFVSFNPSPLMDMQLMSGGLM